jgi:hypothetical protein
MKIENFKKLYITDDDELVSKHIKDTGIVWCSKHWVWIYNKKPRICESEILKDYSLVWCESKGDFEELNKKLPNPNHSDIFDYSFEFDFPSALVKTEYLNSCLK